MLLPLPLLLPLLLLLPQLLLLPLPTLATPSLLTGKHQKQDFNNLMIINMKEFVMKAHRTSRGSICLIQQL